MLRAAALVCLCALLLSVFPACSKNAAPEIGEVRDTFASLIEASAGINDIFFGPGLPVYDRETSSGSGDASYDEESKTYYWIIEDEKIGKIIKIFDSSDKTYKYLVEGTPADPSILISAEGVTHTGADGTAHTYFYIRYDESEKVYVYDENSPVYYDYVLIDCEYQTVDSIKKAAEKVYSTDYLASVYGVIFDGFMTDETVVYARYMEDSTIEDGVYFLKSNRFDPYFETQTTYDCSTMKIIQPSNAKKVIVELDANGRYIDREKLEIVTGVHTKTLTFVLEDNGWRLDTPTY